MCICCLGYLESFPFKDRGSEGRKEPGGLFSGGIWRSLGWRLLPPRLSPQSAGLEIGFQESPVCISIPKEMSSTIDSTGALRPVVVSSKRTSFHELIGKYSEFFFQADC